MIHRDMNNNRTEDNWYTLDMVIKNTHMSHPELIWRIVETSNLTIATKIMWARKIKYVYMKKSEKYKNKLKLKKLYTEIRMKTEKKLIGIPWIT